MFSLCGLNSGSNTSRLFRLASSDLAPSSLIAHRTVPEIPSLSPAVATVGFGRLPLGQVSSPEVSMATVYNRDAKALGIDRLEVGPEFLSPARDLLIHLSSSASEHQQHRTVLSWKMTGSRPDKET